MKIQTENRQVIANIVHLGIMQIANYALPLITVPYLLRVLGPDKLGLIAFAGAVNTYFIIITDYGFNLSGTRQISINRKNPEMINEIFSSIIYIKIIILIVCALLLAFIITFINKFTEDFWVYVATFGATIGQALIPVWLFQGLERMKYITYANIVGKIIYTLGVYIFIKNSEDYFLVPTIFSITSIGVAIISLYLAQNKLDVSYIKPAKWAILRQLKEGWAIFLSSLSISLYTISTPFILGIFAGNAAVGYFTAAEKVITALKGIFQPISHALYPNLSAEFQINKFAGLKRVRKIFYYSALLMSTISILVFINADQISAVLFGSQYVASVAILKIMSALPLLVTLSNITCINTLLGLGMNDIYKKIYLTASSLGIISILFGAKAYGAEGASIGIVLTETYVLVVSLYYLKKVKL